MKAKGGSEVGYYYVTSGNGVSQSGPVAASNYSVTCMAANPGDKVHPTAWSYNVDRSTNFNGYEQSFSLVDGKLLSTRSGYIPVLMNQPAPPNFTGELASAQAKALTKLNKLVRGELDLSIAIAEAGKTAEMIRSIVKAERWCAGITPRRLAESWLEYTYGWRPLAADIYNAASEVTRSVDNGLLKVTASARVKLTNPVGQGTGQSIEQIGQPIAFAKYGVVMKSMTTSQELSRWTSLNPLSIAWELLPYSFVIDWFYNVGDYLRGMETSLLFNTSFLYGYLSKGYGWDYRVLYNKTQTSQPQKSVANGMYHRRHFERSVLSSYPVPYTPTFQADLSWRRLVSAAALFTVR